MIFSMPTFSVNLGILGSQIIWQKSQKKPLESDKSNESL